MRHSVLIATVFGLCALAPTSAADENPAPRPIQLPDILAWKNIQSHIVSNNGQWLAYRLSPNEGNSEIVIRNLKDGKEQRYPIGEVPRPDFTPGGPVAPPSRDLALSEDGKWAAFRVYPTVREAKMLKRQHKPLQTKLVLVELATSKKTEFDKIRGFAFSGEQSTAIAMQRYPATPAVPQGPTPIAPGATPAEDKPQGSDLIVYELASGNELNVGNVSEFSFDKKGNWLAWLIDAQDKAGNGIELRNMVSGAVLPLDSAKAIYKGLSWTEKGDGLATVRGVEDKAWEDKLYTLVVFKNLRAEGSPDKFVFDPSKDKSFPAGMTISPSRRPFWMADLATVTFGIHEMKAKKKGKGAPTTDSADGGDAKPAGPPKIDDEPDKPDMVIWHWKDKRLQPMQQVQENADKNFSFLCLYRPAGRKFIRLGDEDVRQVAASPEWKFAMGVDIREYELESNLDGKRYEDIYSFNLQTGERKLALKKAQYMMGGSPDGTHLLYYGDGAFFTLDMSSGQSYNITKDLPSVFYDVEDDHNVVKPPVRAMGWGWSKDSSAVLLSDGWDIWKAPVHGGPGLNLTVNGKKDKLRYRTRFRLDPEEKGVDLAKPIYVGVYGEWTKKGGIGIIAPGQAGVRMLQWDDAAYAQLVKAKHADVYLYTRETTQDYPNLYLTDASLGNGQKVTDANPQQKNFLWSKGVKLVDYTSDKGAKLQGALYLPANYEPGTRYPTIVWIYEKLSQNANTYSHPSFNGFNIAAYTSNGYAVLTPDIVYKVNDPGMSAVWCILPALKAAEATGVVDPKRVGLHGHSWGGFQTAFMVTQTNAFHAAVAGAPLTDMIAMYNAIYWNSGTANQPIFESSQGRFTGSPSDNLEAYQRNSAVYHAKNVTTPLVILHNDKDGAVDWTQGIEYFKTLRRLGKPVVMLEYKGENHGLRKPENMKDYTVRMKEFFDFELKGGEAPKWWLEGVPLLKMKDEIDERMKQISSAAPPAAPASGTENR